MWDILFYDILFFGIPALVLLLFCVSLYRYRRAKVENARNPGTFPPEEMKKRKLFFVICAWMAGVLVAVVAGIVVLLFFAVAYM